MGKINWFFFVLNIFLIIFCEFIYVFVYVGQI